MFIWFRNSLLASLVSLGSCVLGIAGFLIFSEGNKAGIILIILGIAGVLGGVAISSLKEEKDNRKNAAGNGTPPCGAPNPGFTGKGNTAEEKKPAAAPPDGEKAPVDGMCIAGFVCSVLSIALLGIIFSAIGLSRTRKNGKRGRKMAVAGIVISILWMIVLAVRLAGPVFREAAGETTITGTTAAEATTAEATTAETAAAETAAATAAKSSDKGLFGLKKQQVWLPDEIKENIDKDTRIIVMDYPGIEEDIENYDPEYMSFEKDEEVRKRMIRANLQYEYLMSEMEAALANQEEKVCIVGSVYSGGVYGYTNSLGSGFGSGELRRLPYSTFWLKSCTPVYTGTAHPEGEEMTDYSLYSFDYYGYSADKIEEMKEDIDFEADCILALIPADADCWEKCRIIHDELIDMTVYDHSFGDHCHDLYGTLANHQAVCEGYALAFQYLMKKSGEECEIIQSDPDIEDPTQAHGWNAVYYNTDERYIDVTWDDPDMRDEYGSAFICYDFFGLTKEEISAVDSHATTGEGELSHAESEPFNYYRHQGYLLSEASEEEIHRAFNEQLMEHRNLLSVRFDNRAAYERVKEAWGESCPLISEMYQNGEIFPERDEYWILCNDDLMIYSVGLGERIKETPVYQHAETAN